MNLNAMALRIASLPPWDNLGETVHFSNDAMAVIGKVAKSRETGYQKEFTVLKYPDWVHVAALTADGKIVLVRQYRHGVDQFTLELPGGAVDPGEVPDQAAPRELAEETGYVSKHWEPLGSMFANPAINTNSVHMFLAADVLMTEGLPPDKGEEIEITAVPLRQVVDMCRDGQILHPFTQSTIFRLMATHSNLF